MGCVPTVVIAAGGTAGHVVPALAVADALRAEGAEVSFVGTRERAEAELVPQAGYEIDFLAVSGIDRKNPFRAAAALSRAAAAIPAAAAILRRRCADVVMGGGGYVAAPVGLAARARGLPLILTEADSHLGITNRALARTARRVCLAFDLDGRKPPRYRVTGRPIDARIGTIDRAAGRAELGLPEGGRCLLVFGGSLGARTINRACLAAHVGPDAPAAKRDYQVLHVAGKRDFAELRAALRGPGSDRYSIVEYLPGLAGALAATDLVLARSGGSVFELAAAGCAAILVPYPHATADHQTGNAAWMSDAGAAEVIDDAAIDAASVAATVARIFADPDRLAAMAAASRSLARPEAANEIAAEILAASR